MSAVTGEPTHLQHHDPSGTLAAGTMIGRARWAARAFASYDRPQVMRIASAVARAGERHAREHAEWAVRETGFGVVEHKVRKNLACSRDLFETYRDHDYVTPRVDRARAMVEVPRPAGVVLAVVPSTNPVSTVYFTVLLSVLTRNAVVLSPHPFAKECCSHASRVLAEAAIEAGAPDGIVQWVENPSIPLVDSMMGDERVDLILATGGTGVVRSAYSSGNPALGVGPGNIPVLVDRTADLRAAAELIVDSKEFDHSLLCTNESVLVVEEEVADELLAAMQREGAMLLDAAQTTRLTAVMFPGGRLDTRFVGQSASWIAEQAGLRVGHRTRVLLVPFADVVPEEPMAHEKLSPVLGVVRVRSARQGIDAARAVLRISGAGHSAAIHSRDPQTVMDYAAAVPALRVVVNVGSSTGSSGLDTHLAPSMTIGTGFFGRSGLGHNLGPADLVNWTRVAYASAPGTAVPDFRGIEVRPTGRAAVRVPDVPPTGSASVRSTATFEATGTLRSSNDREGVGTGTDDAVRQEIRAMVLDEIARALRDGG
jgi:acyl-CoA reductase-like NAD-dependent aldehyde dehydrogenase